LQPHLEPVRPRDSSFRSFDRHVSVYFVYFNRFLLSRTASLPSLRSTRRLLSYTNCLCFCTIVIYSSCPITAYLAIFRCLALVRFVSCLVSSVCIQLFVALQFFVLPCDCVRCTLSCFKVLATVFASTYSRVLCVLDYSLGWPSVATVAINCRGTFMRLVALFSSVRCPSQLRTRSSFQCRFCICGRSRCVSACTDGYLVVKLTLP